MKKIFIIGKNRSGTKWLSNTIANHDKVACVQRPGAGGILETNLIYNMPKIFGDLEDNNNFIGFVECFYQTNFCKIIDLDKKELYEGPRNYFKFLDYIMNRYAKTQDKSIWLQKTSTIKLKKLKYMFPEAKFLIIERNPIDNIRSTIGLKLKKLLSKNKNININNHKNIVKELAKYLIEKKRAHKYGKDKNFKFIWFEDLKNNKEKTIRDICKFLNIDFNKSLLEDQYKKNTSFDEKISREEILNKFDKMLIKMLYPIMKICPLILLEKLSVLNKLFSNKEFNKFMSGTFKFRKEELRKDNIEI